MEIKEIVLGLVIGLILGSGVMYIQSTNNISALKSEIIVLNENIFLLNQLNESQENLLVEKENIIESQEQYISSTEIALYAALDTIEKQKTVIETYEKLQEAQENSRDALDKILYVQTYYKEQSDYRLKQYDPSYVTLCDFKQVFEDLSVDEWWSRHGGTHEEWWYYVYPWLKN